MYSTEGLTYDYDSCGILEQNCPTIFRNSPKFFILLLTTEDICPHSLTLWHILYICIYM